MKNIVLTLFFGLLSLSIFAQGNPNRTSKREAFEAQKVAYITSKLDLTTEEAQAFWPIYNEYRTELDALRKEYKGQRADSNDDDANLTDAQIDEMIKSKFTQERKKTNLDEKYYEKFKKALPIPKIAAFYNAERSFKKELLLQLRQKPNGGGQNKK